MMRVKGVDKAVRITDSRHVSFDGDRVPVADPPGVYTDADLVTAGFGKVAFLHADAGSRLRNDHCAHFRHGGLLTTCRARPPCRSALTWRS